MALLQNKKIKVYSMIVKIIGQIEFVSDIDHEREDF